MALNLLQRVSFWIFKKMNPYVDDMLCFFCIVTDKGKTIPWHHVPKTELHVLNKTVRKSLPYYLSKAATDFHASRKYLQWTLALQNPCADVVEMIMPCGCRQLIPLRGLVPKVIWLKSAKAVMLVLHSSYPSMVEDTAFLQPAHFEGRKKKYSWQLWAIFPWSKSCKERKLPTRTKLCQKLITLLVLSSV